MIKKEKVKLLLVLGLAFCVLLLIWKLFWLFPPQPSYHAISFVSKLEMEELISVADYFYNLDFEVIRRTDGDASGVLSVQKTGYEGHFTTIDIDSLEIEQIISKYFGMRYDPFYRGYYLIQKENNVVIFQKWATRDSAVYIVFSPEGESNINSVFPETEQLQIVPLNIENWYYCYLSYVR